MEGEQAKKNFLIKVGVGTIMSLILIFWVLNVKNIFISGADNSESVSEINALKNDFATTVDQMSKGLENVKKADDKLNTASSSLIDELIIETNKAASSSENKLATSTNQTATSSPIISTSSLPIIPLAATTTKKSKFDCPAYIDCMPTVGAARPCKVPAGCEGITQIAY